MAWTKVPREHHPIFHEALPPDPRVETLKMFGGVAAKVNGHIFAGLFGRSVMIWLPEAERAEALALEGAGPFDPMGDGRPRSDKVMLPEAMMEQPSELASWIARAFSATAARPGKTPGAKSHRASVAAPAKQAVAAGAPARRPAKSAVKTTAKRTAKSTAKSTRRVR